MPKSPAARGPWGPGKQEEQGAADPRNALRSGRCQKRIRMVHLVRNGGSRFRPPRHLALGRDCGLLCLPDSIILGEAGLGLQRTAGLASCREKPHDRDTSPAPPNTLEPKSLPNRRAVETAAMGLTLQSDDPVGSPRLVAWLSAPAGPRCCHPRHAAGMETGI